MTTATTILAAGDLKSWLDTNLTWGWTTIRRILLLLALVGGVSYLVATRGNITRAIKFAVMAALFLALLFNIDAVSGLIGSLFTS